MFSPVSFNNTFSRFIPHLSVQIPQEKDLIEMVSVQIPQEKDLIEMAKAVSANSRWGKDKSETTRALEYFRQFPSLHKEIQDPELRMFTILFPYLPRNFERVWILEKIAVRLSELNEHEVDLSTLQQYLEKEINDHKLLLEVLENESNYDRERVLKLLVKLGVNIKDPSLLFCKLARSWFDHGLDLIEFLKKNDWLPDLSARNTEGKTALEFYVINNGSSNTTFQYEIKGGILIIRKLIEHGFACDVKYLNEALRREVGHLLIPEPKLALTRNNYDIPPQNAYVEMMRNHPTLKENHTRRMRDPEFIMEMNHLVYLIENGEWEKILNNSVSRFKTEAVNTMACIALSKGYINTNQFLTFNLILSASLYMNDPDYFTEMDINPSHDQESLRQSAEGEGDNLKIVSLARGQGENGTSRLTVSRKLKFSTKHVLKNSDAYKFTSHCLFDSKGNHNTKEMEALVHYFGLTEEEKNALAAKLKDSVDIPPSEKVVFMTRFPFSISEFSPALDWISHRILIKSFRRFLPIRHGMVNLKRYTEWIQPSVTIYRLVQEIRNPNVNIKTTPIKVSDHSSELPFEVYENLSGESKWPIPIFDFEDNHKELFSSKVGSYVIGGAYAHMLYHLVQATNEGSQRNQVINIRKLILQSLPKNSAPYLALVQHPELLGSVGFEVDAHNLYDKLKNLPGWTLEHTQAVVRDLVENEKKWKEQAGGTWKNLRENCTLKKWCQHYADPQKYPEPPVSDDLSTSVENAQKMTPAVPLTFIFEEGKELKLSFENLLNSDDMQLHSAIELVSKKTESPYSLTVQRSVLCFQESNSQVEISEHAKRLIRIFLAECRRRGFSENELCNLIKLSGEVGNSFNELMRYRPKNKENLGTRNDAEKKRSIELALNLNLGRWDQILPKPGVENWRKNQVEDNLNLLFALKEGLITKEQFVIMNSVVMAYDVRFFESRSCVSENKPWTIEYARITAMRSSDSAISFAGKDNKLDEFMTWNKSPDFLVNFKNEVQAYFPQAHTVVNDEGQIDERVLDDIMHFYGLDISQKEEIIKKLKAANISSSDKMIIKQRVSNGLSNFAPLLWAQKHKFSLSLGIKYIFNPFRVHYDNGHKITELIVPSPEVHKIALSLWNETPHHPAYYFPPEEGEGLLPEELFEEKHREFQRPVQLYWVDHEPKLINNIDGRMAGTEMVAFLHDFWHTLQDTFIRKEGHLMRDLIVESLPKKNPGVRLTDGEALWPIFSALEPFDFSRFPKFIDENVKTIDGWDPLHVEALAKGMVDREEDWKKAVNKSWRDLPKEHWLYQECLKYSKDIGPQ